MKFESGEIETTSFDFKCRSFMRIDVHRKVLAWWSLASHIVGLKMGDASRAHFFWRWVPSGYILHRYDVDGPLNDLYIYIYYKSYNSRTPHRNMLNMCVSIAV